MTQYNG